MAPRNTQETRTIETELRLLMRYYLPLQAIGTTLISVALFLVSVPLGIGFLGLALTAFGIALERSSDAQ